MFVECGTDTHKRARARAHTHTHKRARAKYTDWCAQDRKVMLFQTTDFSTLFYVPCIPCCVERVHSRHAGHGANSSKLHKKNLR